MAVNVPPFTLSFTRDTMPSASHSCISFLDLFNTYIHTTHWLESNHLVSYKTASSLSTLIFFLLVCTPMDVMRLVVLLLHPT